MILSKPNSGGDGADTGSGSEEGDLYPQTGGK